MSTKRSHTGDNESNKPTKAIKICSESDCEDEDASESESDDLDGDDSPINYESDTGSDTGNTIENKYGKCIVEVKTSFKKFLKNHRKRDTDFFSLIIFSYDGNMAERHLVENLLISDHDRYLLSNLQYSLNNGNDEFYDVIKCYLYGTIGKDSGKWKNKKLEERARKRKIEAEISDVYFVDLPENLT